MLYPQTTSLTFANPQACWDWWGYLDANPQEKPGYLLKAGKQIVAIKRMIDRLTGHGITTTVPGPAPGTLLVADTTDSAADLAWSAVPRVTSYTVSRAGPNDPAPKPIGETVALSFADTGLSPATAYRYQVTPTGGSQMTVTASTRRRVPACPDPGTCAVR